MRASVGGKALAQHCQHNGDAGPAGENAAQHAIQSHMQSVSQRMHLVWLVWVLQACGKSPKHNHNTSLASHSGNAIPRWQPL